MTLYDDLLAWMETIPVIDSHEHLPNEAERLDQRIDFFTLFSHYCIDDLAAAGLSEDDLARLQGDAPVDQKWSIFAPYYEQMADGSYARCAHLAMRRFYDMGRLASAAQAIELTARMRAANRPGLYKRVLKDACGIVTAMNFGGTGVERRFFTPVNFVTGYAEVHSPQALQVVEQEAGRSLPTLSRYVQALGEILSREKDRGTKGIKFHWAYMRPLYFQTVPTADAERVFNRIMDEGQGWRPVTLGYEETRPLQDYVVHRLVELAGDLDLTVVFHVGFQARPWMKLDDTRPGQLWSLIHRFRQVRFNMLHAGIPWMEEAAVMAKQLPNLYLDMGWTHAMSPELSTRAVKAYVDLVPRNKVLGFGGDYCVVEKVYGHLVLARQDIARALADKVSEGALSMDRAQLWAQAMLYDNPAEAYQLDKDALALDMPDGGSS
jgi:predicted TIM-barrel fold metal-dependent hydrolase